MKPKRVLGVDFSGASDAGRKIWIAECKRGRGNRRSRILAASGKFCRRSQIDQFQAVAATASALRDPDLASGIAGAAEIDAEHAPWSHQTVAE